MNFSMTTYWCEFFDASGRVFGAEPMRAESDAAAIARAKVIFAHGIGSGYAIRDGVRLVLRQSRSAPKRSVRSAAA
jgi:hypothetical protein